MNNSEETCNTRFYGSDSKKALLPIFSATSERKKRRPEKEIWILSTSCCKLYANLHVHAKKPPTWAIIWDLPNNTWNRTYTFWGTHVFYNYGKSINKVREKNLAKSIILTHQIDEKPKIFEIPDDPAATADDLVRAPMPTGILLQ